MTDASDDSRYDLRVPQELRLADTTETPPSKTSKPPDPEPVADPTGNGEVRVGGAWAMPGGTTTDPGRRGAVKA
eukprot:6577545-Pyramimonas_sp.AAC.1